MDKRFWAIIGIIVVIFGGIFYFTSKSNSEGGTANASPSNHVKGPQDAKVTLTEYGDFQCPVCASYFPVVEQVTAKYADQVKFQFRHFPLTSIHQNAFAAARASEAADKQGKFWQMYEVLYQNQQSWSAGNASQQFEAYARQLGMDVEKFKQDSASSATNAAVNADKREADRLQLSSTPTFFINNRKIELPELVDDTSKQPTAEKFSTLLERELRAVGVEPAAKTE